ncbi:MAG: DUF4089 domain-containing protein [Dehalococcoidia bacterium]|nr:DUF4089 domain-containing protein [Dehalococcoidia bacterium]
MKERPRKGRTMTERTPTDGPDGTLPAFDAEAYLDAASRLIELEIAEADHAAVVAALEGIAAVAADLMAVPLADEVELAPVFTA